MRIEEKRREEKRREEKRREEKRREEERRGKKRIDDNTYVDIAFQLRINCTRVI